MSNDDYASIEGIIRTDYELISGRASEPRDWDRWRTTLAPGARLIPIELADDGTRVARVMTPDEYIASRTPLLAKGDFFEWETAREELRCGSLAHVWSSYEAAHEPGGPPIRKGINSIQLWHDGARWWILSVAWDAVEAIVSEPWITTRQDAR
ncbi:MAG TPA: hypothetical protein VIF83_00305 [Gemmatimonadaceae bacterium]|jgi:hypothetical protein